MLGRVIKLVLLTSFLLLMLLGLVSQLTLQASTIRQEISDSLYLPMVLKRFPSASIFGVELGSIDSAGGLDQLVAAKGNWVRRNAVIWSDVEPTRGARNWSAPSIASLDQELINAANQGVSTILIVRGTPTWAQKYPNTFCGPIKSDQLDAFAAFMRDLVARYQATPYNVKYWEIWNEPDTDHGFFVGDASVPYGCWGESADAYNGGGYYAEMLKWVYPQIKVADPTAQVLVGGLLLECDPRGPCSNMKLSDSPARFLEGILLNGGGPYFDGISFHAYDVYWYKLGQYGLSRWNSAWNTTGPTVLAKGSFVREVLTSYGLTSKFLMNTETGLLCEPPKDNPSYCDNNSDFETTKTYYVAQVYSSAIALGLKANIWFSMYGWESSGLLDSNGNPRPAYNAFRFAAQEMEGARFLRNLSYTGVKGYELDRGDRRIWVLWSLDGSSHTITLPGVPTGAFHVDGTPMSVGGTLTITLEPVYLEWSP